MRLCNVSLGLRVGGVNIVVVVGEGNFENLLNSLLLCISSLFILRLRQVTERIELARSFLSAPICIAWVGAAEETASILLGFIRLIGDVEGQAHLVWLVGGKLWALCVRVRLFQVLKLLEGLLVQK